MNRAHKKFYSVALLGVVLFAVGCNNNTKGSNISPQNRNPVNNSSTFTFPVTGGYSLGTGRLFLQPQYAHMMTDGMKKLLSAYIDPANVGDVDGNSGVTFRGFVEAGNSSGVNSSTSGIEIEIRDSFVGKNENGEEIPPMKLGAQAVSMTGNTMAGQARIVFRTTGAEYVMEGYFDQTNFTGKFSFQNSQSYSSAEPIRSGSGIDFQVPTCQFFRCGN